MPLDIEELDRLREAVNIAYGRYDGALTISNAIGLPSDLAVFQAVETEVKKCLAGWQTATKALDDFWKARMVESGEAALAASGRLSKALALAEAGDFKVVAEAFIATPEPSTALAA